jgi:hypothetical protein
MPKINASKCFTIPAAKTIEASPIPDNFIQLFHSMWVTQLHQSKKSEIEVRFQTNRQELFKLLKLNHLDAAINLLDANEQAEVRKDISCLEQNTPYQIKLMQKLHEHYNSLIAHQLNYHIGPSANHNQVQFLTNYLNYIYQELTKEDSKLTSDKKISFLNGLEHPLLNCTTGLTNRTQELISTLTSSVSVDDLLFQVRMNLVDKIARNFTQYIHTHDSIIDKAKQLGYGVERHNESDPYQPEHSIDEEQLKLKLKDVFSTEYLPLQIIDKIVTHITEQLHFHHEYEGKIEAQDIEIKGYETRRYENFIRYFQTIFGAAPSYEEDIEKYLVIDEDSIVKDINWVNVKIFLLEYLGHHQYIEAEEAEIHLLNTIIKNEAIDPSQPFYPTLSEPKEIGQLLLWTKECHQNWAEAFLNDLFSNTGKEHQLVLGLKLISHLLLDNHQQALSMLERIDSIYQFSECLKQEQYFRQAIMNTHLLGGLVKLLQWKPLEFQSMIFKKSYLGQTSLAMYLALEKSTVLPTAFDMMKSFYPGDIQDILKTPNHNGISLVQIVAKYAKIHLDKLWPFYVTSNLFSDPFFVLQNDSNLNNLLFYMMVYAPDKIEVLLLYMALWKTDAVNMALTNSNFEGKNLLTLVLEHQPNLLEKIIRLIALAPRHIIYTILTQHLNKYSNNLFLCIRKKPNLFSSLSKLFYALEPAQMLAMFNLKDQDHNQILHLCHLIPERDFKQVLSRLLEFEIGDIFQLLSQKNKNAETIFSLLAQHHEEYFQILFKQLEMNSQLKECLIFNPQSNYFSHLLQISMSKSSLSLMHFLLQELNHFSLDQKLDILSRPSPSGTYPLEYSLKKQEAFKPLICFYLSLTQNFTKSHFDKLLLNCLHSKENIKLLFSHLISLLHYNVPFSQYLLEYCCQEITQNIANLDDIYSFLMEYTIHYPNRQSSISLIFSNLCKYPGHYDAFIKAISGAPRVIKHLPEHIVQCIMDIEEQSESSAARTLAWLTTQTSKLIFDIFTKNYHHLIYKEKYFPELLHMCKNQCSADEFKYIFLDYDDKNHKNILMLALEENHEANISLILEQDEALLTELFMQSNQKDCNIISMCALEAYPHASLVLERFKTFHPSNQKRILSQDSTILANFHSFQSDITEEMLHLVCDLPWEPDNFFEIFNPSYLLSCARKVMTLEHPCFIKLMSKISDEQLKQLLLNDIDHHQGYSNTPIHEFFISHYDSKRIPHQNIQYMLERLNQLSFTKEERQIIFDQHSWLEICNHHNECLFEVLELFLTAYPDNKEKIKLFLCTNDNSMNGLMLNMMSRQSIQTYLDLFYALNPTPEDISKLFHKQDDEGDSAILFALKYPSSNTQLLLNYIEQLPLESQKTLLSVENHDNHNILSISMLEHSEMIPRICGLIHSLRLTELLETLSYHYLTRCIIGLSTTQLQPVLHLIGTFPEESIKVLSYLNVDEDELNTEYNLLDKCLKEQQNQVTILELYHHLNPDMLFKCFSKDTLNYAARNPKIILQRVLSLIMNITDKADIVEIFNNNELLFNYSNLDNLFCLFEFIQMLHQEHQSESLSAFSWYQILIQTKANRDNFFLRLKTEDPDFKFLLFGQDVLSDAVMTHDTDIINSLITIISELTTEQQTHLIEQFKKSQKKGRRVFGQEYQQELDVIARYEISVRQLAPSMQAVSIFSSEENLSKRFKIEKTSRELAP